MGKDLKQDNKVEPHLDILVRPTPFLLFVKILALHAIFLVFGILILLVPQVFVKVVTAEALYNFRLWALLTIMVIGEIVTMVTLATWVSEFYIIKSDSLTYRAGVFVRKKQVLMMKRVVEVLMTQSFLGRVFNYGTLTLISTQKSEGDFLKKVENPGKYFKILRELTIAHADRQAGKLERHLEPKDAEAVAEMEVEPMLNVVE